MLTIYCSRREACSVKQLQIVEKLMFRFRNIFKMSKNTTNVLWRYMFEARVVTFIPKCVRQKDVCQSLCR